MAGDTDALRHRQPVPAAPSSGAELPGILNRPRRSGPSPPAGASAPSAQQVCGGLPAPAASTKPPRPRLLPRTATGTDGPCPAPLPRGQPGRGEVSPAPLPASPPLPIAQVQLSLMALCLLPDASFCSFRRISSILLPAGCWRSRGGRGAGSEEEEEEEEKEESGEGGRKVPGLPPPQPCLRGDTARHPAIAPPPLMNHAELHGGDTSVVAAAESLLLLLLLSHPGQAPVAQPGGGWGWPRPPRAQPGGCGLPPPRESLPGGSSCRRPRRACGAERGGDSATGPGPRGGSRPRGKNTARASGGRAAAWPVAMATGGLASGRGGAGSPCLASLWKREGGLGGCLRFRLSGCSRRTRGAGRRARARGWEPLSGLCRPGAGSLLPGPPGRPAGDGGLSRQGWIPLRQPGAPLQVVRPRGSPSLPQRPAEPHGEGCRESGPHTTVRAGAGHPVKLAGSNKWL